MARKSTGRPQSTKPRARRRTAAEPGDRLIDAALALFAKKNWRSVTFEDIAEAAGLTPAEARTHFAGKGAIAAAFFRRIDNAVAAVGSTADGSPRDRLFDVTMRRFDALAPHKRAVRTIAAGLATTPLAGLRGLPRFMASMGHMLELAGIGARGPAGLLRIKGLALIYANGFRIWLNDDSPDLGRTMAALDKGLAWAERGATLCPLGRAESGGRGAGATA